MDLVTAILIVIVVLLISTASRVSTTFDSIPGPFRLPIFGNIQFNFRRLHIQFTEFAHRYGDLYRIQILSQPAIVINSYAVLKDAYLKKGKDFIGRPHMLRFETIGATNGIGFRNFSAKQTELRSQAVKVLSLNGLNHLDTLINENLADLVELLKAQQGMAFDPKDIIKKFLINVILAMLFGEKMSYDDPVLEKIIRFNKAAVKAASIGREDIDVWTWTRWFNPNYKHSVIAKTHLDDSLKPLYEKYRKSFVKGHERGAIDMYIREVLAGNLSDQDVLGCLIDYFVGGVETTATTLYGFLLVLVQSQKMQKRLRADIDDVIGQDRQPHVQDKQSLPYVEACILELFRHQNSLPILIPRMVLQDTQLKGFHIPKGTWVYTNAWGIHHDDSVYSDPYTFNPDRFLDSNGNLLPQDHITRKSIVTFGLGGRSCIGQTLAKTRLFLTLCILMQNFSFEIDENCPPPPADPRDYELHIVLDISPYRLRAVQRQA